MTLVPDRKALGVIRRDVRSQFSWLVSNISGPPKGADELKWILIGTLPNSGSTAFVQILATATDVVSLNSKGEGQWLLPKLRSGVKRWDPELKVNFEKVRHVWSREALRRGGRVVVEKSPPNIVRMRQLIDTLGRNRTFLIVLTRDPLAVCASWLTRYSPEMIANEWTGDPTHASLQGTEFASLLGRLCGERMVWLASAARQAITTVTYEDLTGDPETVISRLADAIPILSGIKAGAKVKVKDYAPQPLSNMNERQISKLSSEVVAAIIEGLRPSEAAIRQLGYALDLPRHKC